MPRKSKKDVDLEEEMIDDEPPVIEPYSVLNIEKTATADEVKSAYRKAALKHHPDKAHPDAKDTAHTKFQEIAFAYAILSDPIRRKRYDLTGSTSETLSADDSDFSWSAFYSEQFRDVVTTDAIAAFSAQYKGSVEERDDVLEAYRKSKGKWAGIYESVMLSSCLEDEERFGGYIDEAIEKGEVQAYAVFRNESERAKENRMKAARREGGEAEEYAKKLGVHDKLFGKKAKENGGGEDALKALILGRQAEKKKGPSFLDQLEAKYAGVEKEKRQRGKKRGSEDVDEEPSEEAFQAAAARLKKGKESNGDSRPAKKSKRKAEKA